MIQAFGANKWAKFCIDRWAGKDSSKLAKLREHDAMNIYMESFKAKGVLEATCDDYRAGSVEDVEEQNVDQKEGRKVNTDVSFRLSVAKKRGLTSTVTCYLFLGLHR
jgi:hypothetical protein